MTSAKGRRWYIYPSRTRRSDWGLHQVFQDHRARFQQCRPSFTSVAAPPQGDLASVGFEKAGIAKSDGGERRRDRRPAGFCQEQTLVLTEQFSSMERDRFHSPYLSDKMPEAVFYGQGMKTVAYLRVSTAQQDVRSQRLAILEYARKHDFRIDDFIAATASGQAPEKRRRLDELMSALQRGDRLVVSEFSRLGRSLGQIVAILDALAKAGVAFVSMKENIRIEGQRDIQTKVMTTLFALFAEVGRDLISEHTREGLAKARSNPCNESSSMPRAGASAAV